MGRLKGIEPSNVGTTIRCVNHFATTAKMIEWFRTESNCRHMELQSIALPTELLNHNKYIVMAVSTGIEPAISCVTGRRVNRYTTGPFIKRRKRDSNPREPLSSCRFSRPIPSAGLGYSSKIIWTLQDSNLRPNGYEPLALTN